MERYRLRSRWVNMLSRCEDADYPQYRDYGGKGVIVCREWHDFDEFCLWCDENNIEPHLQIDRINNDGPYSPDNCRLVTRKQNARNKSTNRIIFAFGETKCMAEWAEDSRCAVTYQNLARRIGLDWQPEEAISTPKNFKQRGPAHNAKYYTAFGETKTANEWSHDLRAVVGKKTILHRVHSDWTMERALTTHEGHHKGLIFEGRTIYQWFQDTDCLVGYNTLAKRLKQGVPVSLAKKGI